jgi:hypothetical protein
MDQGILKTLLRFWTSQQQQPNGVFTERFIISREDRAGPRLPTASTCTVTLKISDQYGSIEEMERYIRLALTYTDCALDK